MKTKQTSADPKDLLDDMEAVTLSSAKIAEVDETDWPEGTVTPDQETAGLIEDVILAGDEVRPLHQKLNKVVDKHRTKIVLLKDKFGVRKGTRGHAVVVRKVPMYWDDFTLFCFDATAHRMNQLLNVKDETSSLTTIVKTPDEEKYLYKKGAEAAKQRAEIAILSLQEKLAALQATPDADELAEKVVVLEARLVELEEENTKLDEIAGGFQEQLHSPRYTNNWSQKPPSPPAVKPTLDDWRRHEKSPHKFKNKQCAAGADYFWNRLENVLGSRTFQKGLELAGDPKHEDDLAALAATLKAASENLRLLAGAVEPAAKNPGLR
jgi:hypothetical protein